MCTTCTKKAAIGNRGAWTGRFHDPFLYDAFYYRDYGVYTHAYWREAGDGHDFTEADAEGLGLGGEGDWEHEMGAS